MNRRIVEDSREDARFVTGRGRYTNDINVPGQTYAAFVRSDHAHGRLRNIDIVAAQYMPGVVGILTGEDLRRAGVGFIHRLPLKGFELGTPLDTPRPGLAQDVVRYGGRAGRVGRGRNCGPGIRRSICCQNRDRSAAMRCARRRRNRGGRADAVARCTRQRRNPLEEWRP
jgi:hypothetical protein